MVQQFNVRKWYKIVTNGVLIIFLASFLQNGYEQYSKGFGTVFFEDNLISICGTLLFAYFAIKVSFIKYILDDNELVIKHMFRSPKRHSISQIKSIELNHYKLSSIYIFLKGERISILPLENQYGFLKEIRERLNRGGHNYSFVES